MTRLPGAERGVDDARVSRRRAARSRYGRGRAPARGRAGRSSGRRGGTRAGRGARARAGRARRREPRASRGRARRASGRRGAGCGGPRGPRRERGGTRARPARSARASSGRSGSRQASHGRAPPSSAPRARPRVGRPHGAAPARDGRGSWRPRPGSGGVPACIAGGAALELGLPPRRVAGHIGLKLYHCSGAAAIVALERVGDGLGRPLELGRLGGRAPRSARCRRQLEPAVAPAPDRDGHDRCAGLRGERRRAGRQRRPRAEQPDRDAVGAIAPVDDQAQHLAPPEHAVQLAQVAPRDERRRPTPGAASGAARTARGSSSRRRRRDRPAVARRSPRRRPRGCRCARCAGSGPCRFACQYASSGEHVEVSTTAATSLVASARGRRISSTT